MIVVKLDNEKSVAGPATVIGHAATIEAFLEIATDRDGARIPGVRLWGGDWAKFPIGARARLVGGEEAFATREAV